MIVTTTGEIAGRRTVRTLGLVRANTIRARHLGKDIMAALRTLVGGEVGEYTKLLAEAREQALDRMVEEARQLGANAIVEVRFATAPIMAGAAELLAFGTAVVVEERAADQAEHRTPLEPDPIVESQQVPSRTSMTRRTPSLRQVLGHPQELLRERFDSVTCARCEAAELARFEQAVGVNRGELPEHPGAPRVIERTREVVVTALKPAEELEVPLVRTSRGVSPKALRLVENALTEPLQSDLAKLAE